MHHAFSACRAYVEVCVCGCAGACLAALLISCFPLSSCWNCACFQEESVDVKALMAMFSSKAGSSDTSIRPAQVGVGRAILPRSDLAQHRLSPGAGPGPLRLPMGDPTAASVPARPAAFPRAPLHPGIRASPQPPDASKVKQTGEMLQSFKLRQPKPPSSKAPPPSPARPPVPALTPALTAATSSPSPRHKTSAEVTPLRRPLPPDGALPLKPRRPPSVNLKPFLTFKRGSSLPNPRQRDGESPLLTHEGSVSTLPHMSDMSKAYLKIWCKYNQKTFQHAQNTRKRIHKLYDRRSDLKFQPSPWTRIFSGSSSRSLISFESAEPLSSVSAGSPLPSDRKLSLPAVMSPPRPPERSSKPGRLPQQLTSMWAPSLPMKFSHAHRNRSENIKKINEVKQSGVIAEMLGIDGSRLVAETWTGTWPTTTWGAWSRTVTVADYCINAEQTWEALYWFGVFVIAESWSDGSHCMDGVRNPKFNLVKSEFHVQTFAESLFKYPSLLVKDLLSFVLFFSCRTRKIFMSLLKSKWDLLLLSVSSSSFPQKCGEKLKDTVVEWDQTKGPLTNRLWWKVCFCRDQVGTNQGTADRKAQKGALKLQEQEKKDLMERQRKENEFKKIFQVIHSFKIQGLKTWCVDPKL